MVVRRIKIWKRRGRLKLAVFSYRILIPSYSSLLSNFRGVVAASLHMIMYICIEAAT